MNRFCTNRDMHIQQTIICFFIISAFIGVSCGNTPESKPAIILTTFQKDSILKAEIDPRSTKIQKMKDYQKYYEATPNYLKNEAGVLYEKNKMTEVIYKIKNLQGYVSSVVIRRIVVDMNGYGVVYEQTTNENGKNSFTRNGLLITETIWFNESTGDNVIKK